MEKEGAMREKEKELEPLPAGAGRPSARPWLITSDPLPATGWGYGVPTWICRSKPLRKVPDTGRFPGGQRMGSASGNRASSQGGDRRL